MAEAAVLSVVVKLGDLLIQKVVFLRGVEKQVEWLKKEIERMQSFLKDAAEKQASDEAVRGWISDIRQVALDAEDVVDNFILKVDDPRRSRGLLESCACFLIEVYHLCWLGRQIESIKKKLEGIDKSRQRLAIQSIFDEGTSSSRRSNRVETRRQSPPWHADKHVVGLEEDAKALLQNFVLEEKTGLSFTSIAGMGGIGKSTLARKVYQDAAVAERFDRRAWICVSQDFRPKELIKGLVLQLLQREENKREVLEIMEKSPEEHLQSMVHERLQGTRYFIVVDDVWRHDHWEYLSKLFPDEQDNTSRILVTSRSHNILRGTGYVHDLKTLDENKSWQLFMKVAFGDNNDSKCPPQLENIAKMILKKCNGLPLAIIVMGGLLLERGQSYSEWEKGLKGMNSYMRREENSVSAVLELSYHDLPPYLKPCFLCLSFFREHDAFPASKLVQIWIAEGFVPRGGEEETMEEIARSYLDELINRNMIQVRDLSKDDNRVGYCFVHDLLHDLSIKKAKEEINFEMLREGNNSESSNKFRHCAVYCNDERIRNPHLRSLFFYDSDNILSKYWKSFGLLRILDMKGLGLKILPDSISSLIGLRYLGLRNNKIKKLPRSLGRLKNLQVLDLRDNDYIEVPNVIWKLYSLRHLYMPGIINCGERLKLDTLKNLQTLSEVWTSDIMVEHLPQMPSLRKLKMWVVGDFHNGWDWLISLQHLVELTLDGEMTELPIASNFPPNLSCLTLSGAHLKEDPMPVLGKLPKLEYLKLTDYACHSGEMVISHDGFPSLRVLWLDSLTKLTSMKVEKGGMPDLKRLIIHWCQSLDSILPEEEGLRLMSNLQELNILGASPKFTSKLRGEKYSSIISNIPSAEMSEEDDDL